MKNSLAQGQPLQKPFPGLCRLSLRLGISYLTYNCYKLCYLVFQPMVGLRNKPEIEQLLFSCCANEARLIGTYHPLACAMYLSTQVESLPISSFLTVFLGIPMCNRQNFLNGPTLSPNHERSLHSVAQMTSNREMI